MYYPSKLNRADAPTRNATPPPPDREKPPWWTSMLSGSFEEFGLWMEEIEVARVGPAAASLLEQFEMQQQAHRLD